MDRQLFWFAREIVQHVAQNTTHDGYEVTTTRGLSEKVAESIKGAEEACSDNPVSEECVAAWDEVEALSAAASHARDKKKETNPLETFCKDNPETDECRTYDD
ncbi:hypothetical protein ACSBR1_032293 [Camellia fascicularis]